MIKRGITQLRPTLFRYFFGSTHNTHDNHDSHDSHDHHDHHHFDRTATNLRDQKTGYFIDPNETARRIMRVIALHDNIKHPQKMKLSSQWFQLGINELDYVEITVGVQNEFGIQFPDDTCEKFKDINDMVQFVARSFWSV